MSCFLVVANRDDAEPTEAMWDDLRPTLAALHAHGGGTPTVLAWAGAHPPTGLPSSVAAVEVDHHLSDWEMRAAVAHSLPDGLVLLVGDGVVVAPDSVETLLADVARAQAAGVGIGMVGARCDSSSGPQLGPDPDGDLVPVDRLEVTLTALPRHLLLDLDPPLCDVAGDAMVTVWLARSGHQSLVSCAYVHRPPTGHPPLWIDGGGIHPEIFERFMHFRTDLLDPVATPGSGPPPPRGLELTDPVAAHHAWLRAPDGLERKLGLSRALRRLDRPREAAEQLWDVDLSTLDEIDMREVAELLRLNGQLLLERQLLDLRSERFGPEIQELDGLLERTPASWLPAQWLADVEA
jgi:hypothetical protein